MEVKTLYKEIMSIADRLEEIRMLLYNNSEHIANFEEDFKKFDDNMFHVQSEVRNLIPEGLLEFYYYE